MKYKAITALLLCTLMLICSCGKKEETPEASAGTSGNDITVATGDDSPFDNRTDEETKKAEEESEKNLKSSAYLDILKGGVYTMRLAVDGTEHGTADMTIYYNKKDMAMTALYSDGTKAHMITKGSKNYIVLFDENMVVMSDVAVASSASSLPSEGISTDGLTYSSKGTGKFLNKNLKFEKYSTSSGGVTTFYFDGDSLVGIVGKTPSGETTTYQIKELLKGVKESAFEIPKDMPLYDLSQAD